MLALDMKHHFGSRKTRGMDDRPMSHKISIVKDPYGRNEIGASGRKQAVASESW